MVARDNELAQIFSIEPQGFEDALREALEDATTAAAPPKVTLPVPTKRHPAPDVRSIQRLPLAAPADAISIVSAYLEWLPKFCRPWLKVDVDPSGVCQFKVAGTKIVLLELSYSQERSSPDRALLHITAGVLAEIREGDRDRLEFRLLPDGTAVLAEIHDFTPALPWFVYKLTQANAHLIVMRAFAARLRNHPVATNHRLLAGEQGAES